MNCVAGCLLIESLELKSMGSSDTQPELMAAYVSIASNHRACLASVSWKCMLQPILLFIFCLDITWRSIFLFLLLSLPLAIKCGNSLCTVMEFVTISNHSRHTRVSIQLRVWL